VPYAPTRPGDQVNIHHCKIGQNNDRLYIRRNYDGTIVAYCHHCTRSGFADSSSSRISKRSSRWASEVVGEPVPEWTYPDDISHRVGEWPREASNWLLKYGIVEEDCERFGVGYSESSGGIVFPFFDTKGERVAFQVRQRFEGTHGIPAKREEGVDNAGKNREIPKYITSVRPESKGSSRIFFPRFCGVYPSRDTDCFLLPVCVVEDVVSAIRITKTGAAEGIALGGVSTLPSALVKVGDLSKRSVIVWLDNDNPTVLQRASDLQRDFEVLVSGDSAIVQYPRLDPKRYSSGDIIAIINDALTGTESEED